MSSTSSSLLLQAEESIERGNGMFSRQSFENAVEQYDSALEALKGAASRGEDPEKASKAMARALSNRSAALCKLSRYDAALQDADAALKHDPTYFKALGRRGAALQGLLRYEEAHAAYVAALNHDRQNAGYQSARDELQQLLASGRGVASDATKERYYFDKSLDAGKASMQKGELHEAVRHFTKAIQLAASSSSMAVSARDRAVLLCNRSAAYFRLAKYEDADADANEAITADDGYARGHVRRAMSLHRLGQLASALACGRRCLELEPGNTMAIDEVAAIETALREQSKTMAERAEADRQRAEALRDHSAAADSDANSIASIRRLNGGASHTSQLLYCSLCNGHGHERLNCPLRLPSFRTTAKRSRDE